jgi:SAM-dependent MidA family methyltransferase
MFDCLKDTKNVKVEVLDESNFKIDEKTQKLIDRQKELAEERKNR